MRLTRFGFQGVAFYLVMFGAFFATPYSNLFFLLLGFLTLLGAFSVVAAYRNLGGVTGAVPELRPVPSGADVAVPDPYPLIFVVWNSLFNVLTGSQQRVGNWPGVTVDRKEGFYRHCGETVQVVDLPGVYSLSVAAGTVSMDERIARDYIAAHEADLVVNILDASNLERNL